MEQIDFLNCAYAGLCSGCPWIRLPYSEQIEKKIEALKTAWNEAGIDASLPEIEIVPIANGGIRDRADFILDRKSGHAKFGLFGTESHNITDLENCLQLSAPLHSWLEEFRGILPDIERGSIRLRVSPKGERGIWLDLANLDVKKLLEEKTDLQKIQAQASVEIGQRRKSLIEKDGQLKLSDPVLRPWFETYLGDEERATPIWTTVGGFTQPGFQANRFLIREIRKQLSKIEYHNVAEFGSGSGNLTLPIALNAKVVHAYELDPLACEGLKLGAEAAGLSAKIKIHKGNFQLAKNAPNFTGIDLVVVDPPRSGLMGFLTNFILMEAKARPKNFLYVSCFAESFSEDSKKLIEMGYELKELSLVDQFPQSSHFEIVSLFQHA